MFLHITLRSSGLGEKLPLTANSENNKDMKADGPFGRLLSIKHRVGVDVKLAVVSQGPGGAAAGKELALTNIFVMTRTNSIYR